MIKHYMINNITSFSFAQKHKDNTSLEGRGYISILKKY